MPKEIQITHAALLVAVCQIMPFEGTRFEGTRYFLNQIEKLNLISNPENRKRRGTPINKRGAHIGMLIL